MGSARSDIPSRLTGAGHCAAEASRLPCGPALLTRARLKLTPPIREWVRLLGTDDLEMHAYEDVVRPADGDYVDVVLAVAQQHDAVDGASRVSGQRSGRGLIRRCSGDDRARPGTPARRDLTDYLGWARLTAVERDDVRRIRTT